MTQLRRFLALGAALVAAMGASAACAHAQGVTTGALRGTVTDSVGNPVEGVTIRATNRATGYSAGAITRANGTYFIQGLEIGAYSVTARRIGFEARTVDNVPVALSQTAVADFRLTQVVAQLQGVRVTATATAAETFAPSNTGTKAVITDTTLQRFPTLTRNLTDFIRGVPQVSASGPGYSAGGMSNRMNNVQIDGATERDVFGLGSTGQPGAQVNAKSVSIEAVKEFQVILAPFDVRQGNFGGLLLNAVTKSGTNQFEGSAFYFYRDQDFSRDTTITRSTPFDRTQYGFSLGGPIVKDKLHFFIVPEFQKENSPLSGPYQGQPSDIRPVFPLSESDRTRFENAMAALGETSLGTSGYVNQTNPLSNFFGRIDYRVNDTHRAVFRFNYANAESPRAQNARTASRVVYTANLHDFSSQKIAPVFQFYSNFTNGTFNEFFLGYNRVRDRRAPRTTFPQIRVRSVPLVTGGANGEIYAGADQFSQGNEVDMDTYELTNNFTMPRGNHTLTFGTRNEFVKVRNLFTQSKFGVWEFANLDALVARTPNAFRKALILTETGDVFFDQFQSAWYAQDQWQYSPRLAITAGLRADIVHFPEDIATNDRILAAYGRNTADFPRTRVQWSPRVGFNWDVTGNQVNQLRGGVGLFVGPPAGVWLANAYANSGNIITFLNCGAAFGNAAGTAPAFNKDASGITGCATGAATRPIGDVNLVDKKLNFPQPIRASLAFDRQLPWELVATIEGLYSRTLNQLFFTNINIQPARGTDKFGRVIFADAINPANGVPTILIPAGVAANGGTGVFSTAINMSNQQKDYAYSATAQLRKRYSNNWEGLVAYTRGRTRDVASFTSSTHISNWQFGRTLVTDQFKPDLGISLFEQKHKVLAVGTYTLSWLKKFSTDVTVAYEGLSGAPHDYIYGGGPSGGSGDLNGDGRQGNDLLYVPTRATDPTQIQFRDITQTVGGVTTVRINAAQQAVNFDNFIDQSECLSKYRGKLLPRNACNLPWSNRVDVALRQNLNYFGGQRASIQLDIFNFANLLNEEWGKQKVSPRSSNSNIPLVSHVGHSANTLNNSVPIVQFDNIQNNVEYAPGAFVSNFWRTQLSFRIAF
jgi:outer membrane receptor protein involved in Fe transport